MKAWELLSKPGAWTKGTFAKNVQGIMRNSLDSDACCWCAMGAISRCYTESPSGTQPFIDKLSLRIGHIPSWNDHPDRTQEDVVSILKELDI